jgi:hypothetical protein
MDEVSFYINHLDKQFSQENISSGELKRVTIDGKKRELKPVEYFNFWVDSLNRDKPDLMSNEIFYKKVMEIGARL